eukprot:gene2070-biopygen1885
MLCRHSSPQEMVHCNNRAASDGEHAKQSAVGAGHCKSARRRRQKITKSAPQAPGNHESGHRQDQGGS